MPAVLILLLQFNNCSKYKQDRTSAAYTGSSSSLSLENGNPAAALIPTGDLCEDTIRTLFANGYYKFVRRNCAGCHASEIDRPQFANPDVNWAYNVFKAKGYTKVSDNAVNASHQAPATGPQHTMEINELKLEWQTGIKDFNTCKGITEVVVKTPAELMNIQTLSKPIPKMAINEEQAIVWDLTKELAAVRAGIALTNLGASAKLSLLIAHRKTTSGEEYYTVRSPVISANSTGIAVKTMFAKINGRLVSYPSTFKYIDTKIPPNAPTGSGLISTGGLVILGTPTDSDSIALAFEKMEWADVQPPPPPPVLGFVSNAVRFVDPTTGKIDFDVQAKGDATNSPVVISVIGDTSDLCGISGEVGFTVNSGSCLPTVYNAMVARGASTNTTANMVFKQARNQLGVLNRFDWDYRITVDSANLLGTDPIKKVSLDFSKDIRKESANRILRLQIQLASANADVTTLPQTVYVVILKVNNAAPINNETTFSSLMKNNGLLASKCVLCHNSRDLNGGYDMTNYQMMLDKGIVVPADFDPTGTAPLQSKMYRRTNANDPINFNLTPMPLIGGLDVDQRALIESWIRAGAKNN